MGNSKRSLAILSCLVIFFGISDFANAAQCLAGLKNVLIAGKFSGSTDCENDQIIIRKIGNIKISSHNYSIYDYRYSLAPICQDCAIHGGQRIIILDNGHYIGQYKPYEVSLAIRRRKLLLQPMPRSGTHSKWVAVAVTSFGLPKQILVDGEMLHFFR